MAQTLYSKTAFTADADPKALTITHGLVDGQGNALTPDVVWVEFTSDQGATARAWTTAVGSATVGVTIAGATNGATGFVHVWKWHSVQAS